MAIEGFVGREAAAQRLQALLVPSGAPRQLVVQSIEGPGGIGKTTFFDHVLGRTDLASRKFLVMRLSGNDGIANPAAGVKQLVQGIATTLPKRASGYFPTVFDVVSEFEKMREKVEHEVRSAGGDGGVPVLMKAFDVVVATGKPLNKLVPKSKEYLDATALGEKREGVGEALETLDSLRLETLGVLERLAIRRRTSLRNDIKTDLHRTLADAVVADLSAILSGYRGRELFRATPRKLQNVDRLLLVLDDFESLKDAMVAFLVSGLLPALAKASFESTVVIIGRDVLSATHPGWDQHIGTNRAISLGQLSEVETSTLVGAHGVTTEQEKARAWRDTLGYPFYLQLWLEELENGGRGALMLQRFYARTTRWMTGEQKKWLHATLFLDAVDIRSLTHILGDAEEARGAFQWFQDEASIRDPNAQRYCVREYLRSRLVDYLSNSDPDQHAHLASRAQAYAAQC